MSVSIKHVKKGISIKRAMGSASKSNSVIDYHFIVLPDGTFDERSRARPSGY